MAPLERSDLLQGTLDLLILKVVALAPVHGYGISQRIRQISEEVLQVQQGSLYPALHRLEKAWLARIRLGRVGKMGVRQSSTGCLPKAAGSWEKKSKIGTGFRVRSPTFCRQPNRRRA